jgi:hypothetical protein
VTYSPLGVIVTNIEDFRYLVQVSRLPLKILVKGFIERDGDEVKEVSLLFLRMY